MVDEKKQEVISEDFVEADIVTDKKKLKIVSKTFVLTGLASIGCGAFCGFYDGAGIDFPYKHLEAGLFIGPAIVQSLFGILDGTELAKKRRQFTGNYPNIMEDDFLKMVEGSGRDFLHPEIYGGIVGWLGEGVMAGLETLAGYGIGYLAGKAVKHFS